MFTGIIQELATVAAVDHGADGSVLRIAAERIADGIRLGDSVSIDGVCLTAVDLTPGALAFEAMHETLERSTLGRLQAGDRVNLESALRAGEPLGGHVVQGHVDGIGILASERAEGFSRVLEIVPGEHLLRYVVEKGSICVAGVSLTVAALTDDGFEVCLIPHTCEVTTLGSLAPGSTVNLEVDILAKYVERLLTRAVVGQEIAATIELPDASVGST
jgi:riboflavin synthase